LGAGGGKNYFSAVRDYIQRLGSFAIEYITFQGGQKERRGSGRKGELKSRNLVGGGWWEGLKNL